MQHRKIIVAGGRTFDNYGRVKRILDGMELTAHDTIISGMARGADSLGLLYAKQHNIPYICMPANWDLYGKSAGYRRNGEMAQIATHLVAFWDGVSKGTKHMLDLAEKHKLETAVYFY